ncbi:MAG TPA: MutS family DNA mismatch repair protein, partial [Flavisolibacter sp.]|nr:MutS family DNA mismatch repair protein [Flavisolibacter sp.]
YGWTRLAIVVLGGVASYFAFQAGLSYGWPVLLIVVILFLVLLHFYTDNNASNGNTERLIALNEDELKILSHQFGHRYDGSSFLPHVHDYAADLDVLGNRSLFQYINRCATEQGRAMMAHHLLFSLEADKVVGRRAAVEEMAGALAWRQQFSAHAMQVPVTIKTEERIDAWLRSEDHLFEGKGWGWFVQAYSAIALGSAIAAIAGYIPGSVFSMLFLLYFIFASGQSKKVLGIYAHLSRIVPEAETFSRLIRSVGEQPLQSLHFQRLKQDIAPARGTAWGEIKSLKGILGRFDLRLNMLLFLFLNSFLLWDVRQARALARWKANNKTLPQHWFRAIAETEVLISIGTLHFNQPSWSFPEAVPNYCVLEGKGLGHPLLPSGQRVTSDFNLEGTGRIALITGSNMAGKSTFLRSLGVNLVLAQMGAPVCAQQFRYSPMKLMSSMRIADDLSENTSTFYAELKKLRAIIDEVATHQPLFILLDEILRGTNSLDRHAGTEALMRQLIAEGTVAVLATHDVALAALSEETEERIQNYHFDVQVADDDELYFDYKLKTGVCQSLNAAILMRKIGIRM